MHKHVICCVCDSCAKKLAAADRLYHSLAALDDARKESGNSGMAKGLTDILERCAVEKFEADMRLAMGDTP